MDGTSTHWRKLINPDYLGSYSLDPGKDIVLTIKNVKTEMVTGPDNRKEECIVATFVENSKPMILNNTNCKTISKMYKTPYIENWSGRKIQIYSESVKAFGEIVDALRIRPRIPATDKVSTTCSDCGKGISGFENRTPEQIAQYTYSKYGKPLCSECATKAKDVGKVEDPL